MMFIFVCICNMGVNWVEVRKRKKTKNGWVKWVNHSDKVYLWSLKIDFLICLTYLFFELSSLQMRVFCVSKTKMLFVLLQRNIYQTPFIASISTSLQFSTACWFVCSLIPFTSLMYVCNIPRIHRLFFIRSTWDNNLSRWNLHPERIIHTQSHTYTHMHTCIRRE